MPDTDTLAARDEPAPSPSLDLDGPRPFPVGSAIAAVVVVFGLVRLLGGPWPHFSPTYPDSFSYLKVAHRGPFHPAFFFDERPIGYPLLQWAAARSSTLIVVAQTLIYVAAFWTLAQVVRKELRSYWIGIGAVAFVAAIAIEPRNSMWNTLILSESLSSSLAIFSIAAWWRAAARPASRTLAWAWAATIAWILVRDTNVLPALVVILPATLLLAWRVPGAPRELRRKLVTGALLVAVVCGYVYVSQAVTHRTQYSVHDVVGMRVLPDPSLTKWFVQGGMPLDDALRGRTGKNAWEDDQQSFLKNPQLARYRTWARGPGGRRLLLSMALRAPDWWKRLHRELPNITRSTNKEYDSYHVFARLPHTMPAPFGEARTNGGLWAMLTLAAAGIATTLFERRRRLLAYMVAIGLLSALVDIWCSYVGDPMEVNRHMVGPLVRLHVLMIMAIALGLDSALHMWRTRRARLAEAVTADEEVGDEPGSEVDDEVGADA